MKTNTINAALALALACAGAAHAAPLPLQEAVITATYNGSADGMLGLDHMFAAEPGSNTSTLDPSGTGVEFFTSDFLFGVDFAANGALTVLANSAIPAGAYSMRFDFGSSLASPITAFTFVGADGASGLPLLSIIDAHTIALDLAGVNWAEYGSLTAQLSLASEVPEPASTSIVLAGLAGLVLARRRHSKRQLRG
ncbi:MAG TPA: PEP-CTERM sorting domain-containing protein [Telluria sp.]|nr:PEP-CTERM sorting domain-containing protein [Telluria sp.]